MLRRLLLLLTALSLCLVAPHAPPASAKPKKPPYRLTVHVSATSVPLGTPVVFTGKVRPKVRGQWVKLQWEYAPGGYFETWDYDPLNRRSRFELEFAPKTPGTYRLRVRIAAGAKGSEAISPVYVVTVA